MASSRTRYRDQIVLAIHNPADTAYLDCLIFREELYGRLKEKLCNYVERVFFDWIRTLNAAIKTEELEAECNKLGRKKYLTDSADFFGWAGPNGCWILAHNFLKHIPVDGDRLEIDPSSLLTLICNCDLFLTVRDSALQVKFLRHRFYGHTPELKLTSQRLQWVKNNMTTLSSFDQIIRDIENLSDQI